MSDLIDRQVAIDAIKSMLAITPTQMDMKEDCLEIIEKLPSAQPEQRWILCSEGLPECRKPVLTFHVKTDDYTYNDYKINFICEDGKWFIGDAIAWMPLPDFWKGGAE